MRKRFAYKEDDDYKLLRIDELFFKGYTCLLKFQNVDKPMIITGENRTFCIKDNGYKWIEVYPDNGKYALTILYDDKDNLIEWYFDISKSVGTENGIPYEDDLYLDLVITPEGKKIILDEDELLEARDMGIITEDDFNSAYKTLKELENKYVNHFDDLIELTDYLERIFKMKHFPIKSKE